MMQIGAKSAMRRAVLLGSTAIVLSGLATERALAACPAGTAGDDVCLVDTGVNQAIAVNGLGQTTVDTFQLGGAPNFSFDAGKIGTIYTNWEVFQKTDTSIVTLTGTAGVDTDWHIIAGNLRASGGLAVFDTSTVTIDSGATFTLLSNETIGSLTGAGGSFVNLGAFDLSTGGNNDTTIFAGTISGIGGLTKQGTGTFTLSGTNTFTGTTQVNGGTLALNGGSALSDLSSVELASGSTLQVGASETIGSLAGAGGSFVNLGANFITVGGNNSSTVIAGVISGTGGITKTGTGLMSLSGTNTYTGLTTISAGILRVEGENAIANTGAVDIQAAGVLQLMSAEQIGALSGAAGSTIDLGLYSLVAGDAANTTFAGNIIGTSGNVIVNLDPDPFDMDPTTVPVSVPAAGGLIKTGTGSLTLSGTNTYVGDTYVQMGTLILSGGSAISDVGLVNVGNGATLRLASSEVIGALSGLGAIVGGGPFPYVPPSPDICAAYPAIPGCSGPITLDPFPSVAASTVDLQGFTLTTNGAINPVVPADVQGTAFGGNIIGTGNLIKEGTGELALSGVNTFTGFTQVNMGTLTLSGGSALSDTSIVTLNNTAALKLLSSERIGSLTGGASTSVTLLAATLTTGDVSNTTFSGAMSGSGGLTKVGTGTFTLAGSNSFTGPTNINAGTLRLSNGSALSDTSAVTIATGAQLELLSSEIIGKLTGAIGSTVILGNNFLTINATGTPAIFAGQISGTGGVEKSGAGTQRLSGTNTYMGSTLISVGTLEISGGSAISDISALSINAPGTLTLLSNETIGSLSGAAGSSVVLNTHSLTTGDAANTTFAGSMSGIGSLVKQGTGTFALSGANTYSGGTTISAGKLQVQNGSALADTGSVVLAGTGILELLNSETIGTLSGVFGTGIELNANTLTVNMTTGPTTFGGAISGTGAFTKSGTGALTLSGANVYTGLTTVNGGTLALSGGSAIDDTAAVLLNVGGTLQLLTTETIGSLSGAVGSFVDLGANTLITGDASTTTFAGMMFGSGNLVKQGSGVFSLSGPNSFSGTTTVNAGTLSLASGSAISDTGTVVVASGAILALSSSETIGSLSGVAGASVNLGANTLTTGNGTNNTFAGAISGAGGLTKQGTGIFTLAGANTYTGQTIVNAGTLALDGGNAIFNTASVHVASGASLQLLASETIGALTGNVGALVVMGANTLTVNPSAGSSTFSGSISGSGDLIKSGAGSQILAGNNTHTGFTMINAGALTVSGGGAISDTGNVSVNSGGTFAVAGSETIGSLSGVAGSSLNLAAGTLTTGGATNTTFAGAIFGPGNLTKQGSGVFTISGSNTSTGLTTVTAGTLALSGGSAIGDGGAVNVASGGTLNLANSETVGNLSGNGSVVLGTNILTTGDGSNTAYAGSITGTGGVTKIGAGNFSTANLGYTGLTTVNSGVLNVNGSIAGSVLINAAGTLSGTHTIAGDLTNFGTLASGNSPGSTIIGGNYVGGGLLNAEIQLNNAGAPINGTTHDYLQVAGNVTGNTLISIVPVAPSNAPAAITGLGIELVRVGGNVASNAFALSGQVIQGGFEYFLRYEQDYAGTSDGFFLQSTALQELSLNAALLSLGRSNSTLCIRSENSHPGFDGSKYRTYADVRHGSMSAGSNTGSEYDANQTCFSAGADAAIGDHFFVGVSGSYGKTDADVNLPQGTAKLIGDGGRYQAHAGYMQGNFFAVAALGYAKTEWDVAKAGGGFYVADVKGQLGHLLAGYKLPLDGSTSITLSSRLDYNGTACGDGCLIAAAEESVSEWSATAAARIDAAFLGSSVRPYLALALTDDFEGGNAVSMAGATSISNTRSMLLDADLGFDAMVASDLSVFAQGRVTRGLQSDVEGYEARGGVKLSF